MSYPDARYLGDSGEISAVWRPASQEPELTMRSGTASYLATGTSANGQFGLYRWDMAGPPSGPDPHFHRTISESFFVLSGAVRLFDGARWIDATAGDFLFVPEGGLHTLGDDLVSAHDGDVVDAAAPVPRALFGTREQQGALADRPHEDDVRGRRHGDRSVAVAGAGKGGVREQEHVPAVRDGVAVDHRHRHAHPNHRAATTGRQQLDA